MINWIKRWESDGETKIDGIGTQMHVSYILNEADQKKQEESIVNMFELLAASGKLIKITELDMGIVEKHLVKVSRLNWLLLNSIRRCLISTNSLFRSILKSSR